MINITLVPIIPTDTSQPVMVPGLVRKQQCQTQWCWAACAEMALLASGLPDMSQCSMANFLFPNNNCCRDPGSRDCNNGCEPDQVTALYGFLGMEARPPKPLPDPSANNEVKAIWQIIRDEMPEGNGVLRRPVEIHFEVGGGSHVVLISGWAKDDQGALRFHVVDPLRLADSRWYAADALSTFGGSKLAENSIVKWANMWFGIQPK